ncbi:MAG: HD domain-containing protein [Bryobacterales bacterium]|nr:HD domain-containing protein [Bryobacterales bacterium]
MAGKTIKKTTVTAEARIAALKKQLREARQSSRAARLDTEFALELERRRSQELEEAYYDTVLRLTRASAYKDRETGAHIQRVSHYAKILARQLGWSDDDQELIFRAAPMHDVGKIAIPDDLIRKRGSLNGGDRQVMESHTQIGASLLEGSTSRLLDMAREIALTHHERWDGSGYPHGLVGEQIPISGRIVMLSDHYDALRSRRSYKRSIDHEATCRIILEGDGRTSPGHFDPRLLEIFAAVHGEFDAVFEQYKDESQR